MWWFPLRVKIHLTGGISLPSPLGLRSSPTEVGNPGFRNVGKVGKVGSYVDTVIVSK